MRACHHHAGAGGAAGLLLRALAAVVLGRILAPGAPLAEDSIPQGGGGEPRQEAPSDDSARQDQRFAIHYQATVASQWHPTFPASYSGPHSMQPGEETATSVVMDVFAGVRPWKGAELQLQPELAGGSGLSSTLGVAAFPSGEVYRVGNPRPSVVVGRAFLRQVIGLGGGRVPVEPGPSQLGGERDRDALTLPFGKVATTDFVDGNPVSNDPHTGFMSWGLWASAAYDYPADTRGYTWGLAAELTRAGWSVRGGLFLEPKVANGMDLEYDVSRARGLVAEVERRYALGGRPGAARVLSFLNTADMGSYEKALESPGPPDVQATRTRGRTKAGFAASANQDLGGGLSAFLRVSWNDGRNESWAFTEIDRSLAAGAVQSGSRWGRDADQAGIAVVVSGLSELHRRYLAAGGLGFILGDGALSYAPEVLAELYYRLALTEHVSLGANYQPVFNPGFNRDRGPVQVLTGRFHVEL